jgi:hypothetical protein
LDEAARLSDLVVGLRLAAYWTKGGDCQSSCLRWCSETGEGIERRVASSPSPQQEASSGRTLSRESGNKNKEESSSSTKSLRRGDKKKKIKKVVYYETDSSSPSTSSSESFVASKRHERKKYSKMPLRYPRISKRAPLLFVPLGKPPYFDGEDYCM